MLQLLNLERYLVDRASHPVDKRSRALSDPDVSAKRATPRIHRLTGGR
jgi:hypothetical protein